jgi:DNA (cytosine-5)-methyltransferase 1
LSGLRVVSLFTGAGGLDYGFEAAGASTCVAVEMDEDCCKSIRANRRWAIVPDDIHGISGKEILNAGRLGKGQVDILIGGPPCQPFSKSGYWVNGDTKRLSDPRADTLQAYMRCVEEMQPKVFLLENVHGISYSGKEEGFRLLQRVTEQINLRRKTNYRLHWAVLNAADYGVPQLRTRFFLVAEREGRQFRFPAPTHGDPQGDEFRFSKLKRYATSWDAIGHLNRRVHGDRLASKGTWAALLPSIPEGENYLWHTSRKGGLPLFGWRTRYWSFLLKLAKNRPSWTIQAQPGPAIGPFHWKNRLLSVDEMACLQTFPKSAEFVGGRISVQRQIGNAVPSLLAEVIARGIGEQFFEQKYRDSPKLAVILRRFIPSPERTRAVPEKYLHLLGDHPEHPGTGRGKAARLRREDDAKEERQLALTLSA